MRLIVFLSFVFVLNAYGLAGTELKGPPPKNVVDDDENDDNTEGETPDNYDYGGGTKGAAETKEEENLRLFKLREKLYDEGYQAPVSSFQFDENVKKRFAALMDSQLSDLLDNQEKEIQRLESELEELDKRQQQADSEREQVELAEPTPEQIQMEYFYQEAMQVINKTKRSKLVDQTGYSLMHAAANMGHPKARAEVAWDYLFGVGSVPDIEKAKTIFTDLAETGMPKAHMGLGFMYATGIGFNVSQAKAILHYTMAALGDNTWAQMALGYRYWSGITVPNSCERALEFYRKVAAKVASRVTFSGGPALHRIRLLDEVENSGLSSGILDNDLIEYYQLLADKGDVQAQVGLGQLHYQGGRGIPLDYQKALQYFTQAANAGNAVAMAFLGKIYLEGTETVKADNDTALRFFKKAADLNNPVGQSGLGIMYLEGKGVPKDTTTALKYFTLAADQGWVDGQLQLGNMYFAGTGVKRDFKMAYKYFNLASQSGNVLAFYNLGQMHAYGLGIIRSCPTAVELFKNVAERERRSDRLMAAHKDYKGRRFELAFIQYALMAELGYEVAQSNAAFILDRGKFFFKEGFPPILFFTDKFVHF